MSKINIILKLQFLLLIVCCFSISCDSDDTAVTYEERVVIANRGAGSISFINAENNELLKTLTIANSEPMYVVYVPSKDRLYVGDRASNKVHIVNPELESVEGSIDVGSGVFHMWADGQGNQLWVNNDIDNTASIIDLNANTVIQTIEIGAKPHDVFVTADGTKAYISIINADETVPDQVFMYSTSTFQKEQETSVGKDPHLFHLSSSNKLFVPCQSGELYVLNGNDLSESSNTAYTGAHGIFGAPNQSTVFVANIEDGQLYSIDASTINQNGTALNTTLPKPHNLVVNESGDKMFVTHSGATANAVTSYSINAGNLTFDATITTATNPFGLAYYKREK